MIQILNIDIEEKKERKMTNTNENINNENCTKCEECNYCSDCQECTDCSYCHECMFCSECEDCTECNNCSDCQDCVKCSNCSDCHECERCEDCSFCVDCYNLSNRICMYKNMKISKQAFQKILEEKKEKEMTTNNNDTNNEMWENSQLAEIEISLQENQDYVLILKNEIKNLIIHVSEETEETELLHLSRKMCNFYAEVSDVSALLRKIDAADWRELCEICSEIVLRYDYLCLAEEDKFVFKEEIINLFFVDRNQLAVDFNFVEVRQKIEEELKRTNEFMKLYFVV